MMSKQEKGQMHRITRHPLWGPQGARGPVHQAERVEGKKREEEVRCPWRGPGQGYIVQSGRW